MKARKAMKGAVAKGKLAKSSLFSGRREKTVGGLKKENLTKTKNGRVVWRNASARAKRVYASSPIKAWADSVKKARTELGIKGFVVIGGKSAAGRALYAKAKAILASK